MPHMLARARIIFQLAFLLTEQNFAESVSRVYGFL